MTAAARDPGAAVLGLAVAWYLAACSPAPAAATVVTYEHHMENLNQRLERRKRFVPKRFFSKADQIFMENCSQYQDIPSFHDHWKKSDKLRVSLRVLYENGLSCRRKPDGPIEHIAAVSTAAALEEIGRQGDKAWQEETFRQEKYDVHKETETVALLWKQKLFGTTLVFPRWQIWEPILEPAVRAACDHYGYNVDEVDLWKAMLTRVRPNSSVMPHEDIASELVLPHRVHWAISGEEGVRTFIGSEDVKLQDGDLFEFNNVMLHTVANDGTKDRIHAIFDLVPRRLTGNDLQYMNKTVEREFASDYDYDYDYYYDYDYDYDYGAGAEANKEEL